jgi:hypothetical protein
LTERERTLILAILATVAPALSTRRGPPGDVMVHV